MRVISFILILLISFSASSYIPDSFRLKDKTSKDWEEQDRPESNFILDILNDPYSESATDSVVFAATGAGYTMGYSTFDPISGLKFRNSVPGYGGSSSIAIDKFSNIWITTAADSFITDEGVFLPTGSGVHMTPDSGKTWTHFRQPGITPIQGLTYDMACDPEDTDPDSIGIWMACFGQSLQRTEDSGRTWRTLTCDSKEWDPFNYMNQRMFSVHIAGSGNIWVGTAEGINLCTDYKVPDSMRVWKQYTYSNGLTGNFVTAIASKTDSSEAKEYVFASSWLAENSAEMNGISYTDNDGLTWNKCLLGEKVFDLGFHNNSVYACSENGLWKSDDNGKYWEKYVINAWSETKKDHVKVDKVYSFLYHNSKMFVGTGNGMVVSEDNGNSWRIIEAYEPSSDSSNGTYAYPNPFSPVKFGEVKLQFRLKKTSHVTCRIYNFAMERVKLIETSGNFISGEHYLTWDGKDDYSKTAANGVYFYVISSEDGDVWNKIIIFE
jgi:hypothetical protein